MAGSAAARVTATVWAARHTMVASPTGSAAATSISRCVAAGSSRRRRSNASSICWGTSIVLGSAKPPARSAPLMPRGQLDQRQGIAAGLGDDPIEDPFVEAAGDHRGQQGPGVGIGQSLERQVGEAGQLAGRARLAHGDDHRHRLGAQPPGHEADDLARGVVQPLGVLHEAQQRTFLGHVGQQAQRRQRHHEPIADVTRRQPEGHAQGPLLRLGKGVEVAEHRRAQLVQAGVGELHLGLHAGDLGDAEAGGLAGGVAQQGRLADARLAADHQHRALSVAHVVEQLIEDLSLPGPATERCSARGGHVVAL